MRPTGSFSAGPNDVHTPGGMYMVNAPPMNCSAEWGKALCCAKDATTRVLQAAKQHATSCMLALHVSRQPTPLAKTNLPACLLGRPVDGCEVDGLCGHLGAVEVGGPC